MDLKSITQPVGIMRILVTILTCMCFILVATVGYDSSSYWGWCMFAWCFCCFLTLLIVILEFTSVSRKLPFAWDDFTAAFAILASLMCLSVSIIYPTFYTRNTNYRQIGASVVSWFCFAGYVGEVVLTHLRPRGETSGFLSTLPGIMKMLETFFSCLIFISLERGQYLGSPALQWCVAVYSLCFIFVILIMVCSLTRLKSMFPFSFDKLAIIYNIVAAVMYMTAMVIWPLYTFSKRPPNCGHLCTWDKKVFVTIMTIFNCIVYTLDTMYMVYRVFFVSNV
ncbi:myeloid-associated differentiation marker homolog [Odontesthes bonariensis]|uniref:myeloid-associated differentiation marker homolog n=1 Tax=Odontesthes bonariensis TaxID=219752 RepID=UPI003F58BC1D